MSHENIELRTKVAAHPPACRLMALLTALMVVLTTLSISTASAGQLENEALEDAILGLDVAKAEAALKGGANPNAVQQQSEGTWVDVISESVARWIGMGVKSESAGKSGSELCALLLKHGATIDGTALYRPIVNNQLSIASFLVEHGASDTAKLAGYSPAEFAWKWGREDIYRMLMSHRYAPVSSETAAQIDLIAGSQRGSVELMEAAISKGASINDADPSGRIALVSALSLWPGVSKHQAAVQWLLSHHANPNIEGVSGEELSAAGPGSGMKLPSLHAFVFNSGFILHGTTDNPMDKSLAESTLQILLKAGAEVSGKDSRGMTPLHWAVRLDNGTPGSDVEIAAILIRQGANVMAEDAEGKTPLEYAETAPLIQLLKENGATK